METSYEKIQQFNIIIFVHRFFSQLTTKDHISISRLHIYYIKSI